MRCYFHLVNSSGMIRDDIGVEVSNIAAAETEALRAIDEMRQEDEQSEEEWQGWRLSVTDGSGWVVMSIPLGSPQKPSRPKLRERKVLSS
jgi:hypothetical protein